MGVWARVTNLLFGDHTDPVDVFPLHLGVEDRVFRRLNCRDSGR